jgi:phage baseplate assembly protein W
MAHSDFGLLFKKHPSTKDIIRKIDVESVKQALTILFMTNKMEKKFNTDFGIGLYGMLFEPMTPLTKMTLFKRIQQQVEFYEPRVVIEDIIVDMNVDGNTIDVKFFFYVVDNPEKQQLSLNFERVR